uniref:Uncharacterized protein n=1 Tax=Anguilla anguilla TaxID=7936 RepID=A0A0E9QEP4_ANGAN
MCVCTYVLYFRLPLHTAYFLSLPHNIEL